MIERRVQPVKQRVTLLHDYFGVEVPSRETTELLEATEVAKQVEGLVSSGIVAATECAMEAFSAIFRPNLVSRPGSFPFSLLKIIR